MSVWSSWFKERNKTRSSCWKMRRLTPLYSIFLTKWFTEALMDLRMERLIRLDVELYHRKSKVRMRWLFILREMEWDFLGWKSNHKGSNSSQLFRWKGNSVILRWSRMLDLMLTTLLLLRSKILNFWLKILSITRNSWGLLFNSTKSFLWGLDEINLNLDFGTIPPKKAKLKDQNLSTKEGA